MEEVSPKIKEQTLAPQNVSLAAVVFGTGLTLPKSGLLPSPEA